MFKEIATLVSEKCVNPETNRPYPVTIIEKAMKDAHYSIKPNKGVKPQALDVIRILKEHIPLEKAQMRVKITMVTTDPSVKTLKKEIPKLLKVKESEHWEAQTGVIIALIDPGNFKLLDDMSRGTAVMVEVVSLKQVEDNEEIF
jgi:ribosome maturation protein SDO1